MENKIELVCPECNEKFNVDIFTSINVQMDKDMKNRVLSGKLFDMECAHCHSKFHIPYPVLYHDMEKKLLIQFTDEKELDHYTYSSSGKLCNALQYSQNSNKYKGKKHDDIRPL